MANGIFGDLLLKLPEKATQLERIIGLLMVNNLNILLAPSICCVNHAYDRHVVVIGVSPTNEGWLYPAALSVICQTCSSSMSFLLTIGSSARTLPPAIIRDARLHAYINSGVLLVHTVMFSRLFVREVLTFWMFGCEDAAFLYRDVRRNSISVGL